MSQNDTKPLNILEPLIAGMQPKRQPGALPKVTPCPYCGASMSQGKHSTHRADCQDNFKSAPPQAPDFMHDAGGGYNANRTFPQT